MRAIESQKAVMVRILIAHVFKSTPVPLEESFRGAGQDKPALLAALIVLVTTACGQVRVEMRAH